MLRHLNMLALLTTATAWATLLIVGGGLLVANSAAGIGPWSQSTITLFGLAGVAAGIFVFEVIVADRLFPYVVKGLRRSVETMAGVLMLTLTGAALAIWLA